MTSPPYPSSMYPYAPGPSPRTATPWLSPAVLSMPQTMGWPGSSNTQSMIKPDVKTEPGAYVKNPYGAGPSPGTANPWLSPAVLSMPQTMGWPGATTSQSMVKTEAKTEPGTYAKSQMHPDHQSSVFSHCQTAGMPDDIMNQMNSRRYLQLLDQHPHAAHSNPQAAHPLMPPLGAARFWDMGCYFGSHTPAMAHSASASVAAQHVAPTAPRMPGYDGHGLIGLGSIATNVLHHPVSASTGVENHHHMTAGLPHPPPAHPSAHAAAHHAVHLGATHPSLAPPPPPPHVPVCSSTSVSMNDAVSNLKFYPGGTNSGASGVSLSGSEPSGSSVSSVGDAPSANSMSSVSHNSSRVPQAHASSAVSATSQQNMSRSAPHHQPSSASATKRTSSAAGNGVSGAAGSGAASGTTVTGTGPSAAGMTDAAGLLAPGAERPFICETCNKGFTKEHHLKTHKRIHTGERPYGCDVCGKAFSKAYHLKRHKSIHTGERPFVCEECGKAFSEAYYLKRHRSIHSGERPHACESCGKSFSKAYYLKRHQTIHTGERRQFYNMWSKGGQPTQAPGGPSASGSATAAAIAAVGAVGVTTPTAVGVPSDPGASSSSPVGRKPPTAVPTPLGAATSATAPHRDRASNDASQRPV